MDNIYEVIVLDIGFWVVYDFGFWEKRNKGGEFFEFFVFRGIDYSVGGEFK